MKRDKQRERSQLEDHAIWFAIGVERTTDTWTLVHIHFELPRADLRRYMSHRVARGHQTVGG